jgi:DNA polymerase-3 subunit alpha
MYALKPSVQELAWSQAEFETVSEDGTRYRWKWVEKRGKNTKLLRCKLGDRMVELIGIIPPASNVIELPQQDTPAPKKTLQDLFVNLHGHTEYSDGLMSTEQYLDQIDKQGQSAAAITDHGTMAGVAEFLLACKKKGKKGIAGNELYMRVPEVTKHLKESELKGDYKVKDTFHQLAIALNPTGYRNLSRLTTLANALNDKRSVTFDQLEKHQEGLIITSSCLAGVIPQLLLLGKDEMAYQWAERYQKIWGNRFYIELQDHQQSMYVELNQKLLAIATEFNIECIITADSHYLTKEDYLSHSIFQSIKWGKTLNDPARTAYDGDLFVSGSIELKSRFPYLPKDVLDRAIQNTNAIAQKVEDYNIFRKPTAPPFPIPTGYQDNNEYLEVLAQEHLDKRFPNGCGDEYRDRLKFELSVIAQMGFSDYFLVVWDLVRFARNRKIPVGAGRGSAAGSLVTYVLGITNIDPVHHGLLFERFLNPERVSMPDIDLDFCPERRKEIIAYLVERYGQDRVAQISTSNTMKSKAVLQDVGRVLDIPPKERDALCKLIPTSRGKVTQLAKMLEQPLEKFKPNDRKLVEQFRNLYQTDPKIKDWVDKSRPLEGKRKTAGVHAAAVVIADIPITDLAPIRRAKDDDENEVLATEYSMAEIEELGFIKMDILGIANLTLLENVVELVKQDFGIEIDPDAIPWHDPKIFDLFAKGETDGIFQFESDGMKQLLVRLKPSQFEDIVAANALFRPGCIDSGMLDRFVEGKHGGVVTYPAPQAKPTLEVTYGQAIYQEQLMKLAQDIAGNSLGQADLLRRACGKKKMSEMIKHEGMFTQGCLNQGHSEKVASELWQIILNSAEYSFNRSHSLSYSRLGWQCAYFKVYYPLQFMAALLTANAGKTVKLAQYLNITAKYSIKTLPPDINKSAGEFITVDGAILYGFKGISGLGDAAIASILTAREEKPFESLADFCDRAALSATSTEGLIKVGAFDELIPNRASAIAALPAIKQWAEEKHESNKKSNKAQLALFSMDLVAVPPPKITERKEYSLIEQLEFEYDILGAYLSGHPLDFLPEGTPLSKLKARTKPKISVRVVACYPKESKNGVFANLELEDKWGDRIKGVCWADEYLQYSYALDKGSFVHLDGRVTEWNDQTQYTISHVLQS